MASLGEESAPFEAEPESLRCSLPPVASDFDMCTSSAATISCPTPLCTGPAACALASPCFLFISLVLVAASRTPVSEGIVVTLTPSSLSTAPCTTERAGTVFRRSLGGESVSLWWFPPGDRSRLATTSSNGVLGIDEYAGGLLSLLWCSFGFLMSCSVSELTASCLALTFEVPSRSSVLLRPEGLSCDFRDPTSPDPSGGATDRLSVDPSDCFILAFSWRVPVSGGTLLRAPISGLL